MSQMLPDDETRSDFAEKASPDTARRPSLTRYLLIALGIAVVISLTMGAPAHQMVKRTPEPWAVAKNNWR